MPACKAPAITWCRPDESVVACHEKIKVLNENYNELQQLLQDALDDALLLGCSEKMVRDAFQQALDHLQPTVAEDTGEGA